MELTGIQACTEEWSERCSTAIHTVSGYVVVVITVLPSRAVTLASSYLANLSGRTAVSHLRTRPDAPTEISQRVLEALPGQTHARACLLDHTVELREALAELLGHDEVRVEIADTALDHAERVWSRHPAA